MTLLCHLAVERMTPWVFFWPRSGYDGDMAESLEIRESRPSDLVSLETLYPDAFPEEDLLPLVGDLLREAPMVLSLVGIVAGSLAGHAVFTTCGTTAGRDKVALLGPLAVAPARQGQGIGSALVRAGLQRLETAGASRVYVLGDPAYYGRLGFGPEAGVAPPYPLPAAWRGAWQSIGLGRAAPPRPGRLSVPRPWQRAELWAP